METGVRVAGHEAASLDAEDVLLPFLPELLQDLWSLGFSPEPAVRLLQRNREALGTPHVLDLGCGKGALLIRVAEEIGWKGLGVDLIPEFIEAAGKFAAEHRVTELVAFQAADMRTVVARGQQAELVCFGFDSDALGPLQEALTTLRGCIPSKGFVLLDTCWTLNDHRAGVLSKAASLEAIAGARFAVWDAEIFDPAWVRDQERENTARIRVRAQQLAGSHPELAHAFVAYVQEQEAESYALAEQTQCLNLLLRAL